MAQYEKTTFERMDRTGTSDEYRTYGNMSVTLAYLDTYHGRTDADVQVFDPTTSRSRSYRGRAMDNAQAIIDRHLRSLGY
jgi:hypothetical protein